VFSEEAASRLPDHKEYDHHIDLKPDFQPKSTSLYHMTPEEDEALKEFI